jgi:flagellar biosynthesis protein FliQ
VEVSFAVEFTKKQAITTYHHRTLLHVPKIARDVIFMSLVMAFLAATTD